MKQFINKIIRTYRSSCLCTKSLILIGMFGMVHTVMNVFLDSNQICPNDVAIRSVMGSIFGFIFGSQVTENSNIKSKNVQAITAVIVAFACLFTLMIGDWVLVDQELAPSVEIRNLLFSAVGFLLSRVKR